MDTAQTLYHLARTAVPTATVRVSVEMTGGGNTVATTLCKVVLTAPDLLEPVTSQGVLPEDAALPLRKKYAAGRRQYAIDVLLRECGNLAGGLPEEARQEWAERLTAARDVRAYETLAASYRTAARQMGLQAA